MQVGHGISENWVNSSQNSTLKELLQGVLDPQEHLIPAIARRIEAEPHDVIFLSGVGEVYPFLRSHNVLNNLQSTAKDRKRSRGTTDVSA